MLQQARQIDAKYEDPAKVVIKSTDQLPLQDKQGNPLSVTEYFMYMKYMSPPDYVFSGQDFADRYLAHVKTATGQERSFCEKDHDELTDALFSAFEKGEVTQTFEQNQIVVRLNKPKHKPKRNNR